MSLKTQLQANNAELQNHLADIMKLPDISDLKKGAYVWKKYKYIKDETLTNPTFTGLIGVDVTGDHNFIKITDASFDRSSITDIDFFNGFTTSDGVNKFEYVDGVLHYFWGSGSTQHWQVFSYDNENFNITTGNWPYEGTFNFSYTGEKTIKGKVGDFYSYVADNNPDKYPNGGIGYDGFYYELYGEPVKIVSWADGTDEEIVEMVAAADRGEFNLSDYWAVGQERKVTLNAMSAANGLESHTKQEVTLVLMHAGGMTLENPVESGRNTCSFVVGLKNSLKETGKITTLSTNTGGWKDCTRRTWCNNKFKSSIPSTLLPIFKAFKNKSTNGNYSTTLNEVVDYFCLPSEYEVSALTTYSQAKEGFQFEWYKTRGNRVKKKGDSGADGFEWFLRSCYKSSNAAWCYISTDGSNTITTSLDAWSLGVAPFGCI